MNRTRFILILLPVWLVVAQGCAGVPETDVPYLEQEGPGRDQVENATQTALSSNVLLRRFGVSYFHAGKFDAAIRHLEPLHEKYPSHFMGAAYLGLAWWRKARPDRTREVWDAYAACGDPILAKALKRELAALTLIDHRREAKKALNLEAEGEYPPVASGRVAVGLFKDSSRHATFTAYTKALNLLLIESLSGRFGLLAVSRPRTRAYLEEAGLGSADGLDEDGALRVGRLLGAEFVVFGEIGPGPAEGGAGLWDWHPPDPNGPGPRNVRIRVCVKAVEPQNVRRERLEQGLLAAGDRLSELRKNLKVLRDRAGLHARGLAYFQRKAKIEALIQKRAPLAEEISAHMREGRLERATQAIKELERVEAEIKRLYALQRRFERAPLELSLNVFRITPEYLEEGLAGMRKEIPVLERETSELEAHAQTLVAKLTDFFPAKGTCMAFDASAGQPVFWPESAALLIAKAVGEKGRRDRRITFPYAYDADLKDMAALNAGLNAWDNGEFDAAVRIFQECADFYAAAADSPGSGFDPMVMAEKAPDEIVKAALDNFRAAFVQAEKEYLKAGGTRGDFIRGIEGR